MSASSPAFAGSVPEHYHRRLVPLIFDGYARDLARRVRVDANMAILETACGTGAVTRALRRRVDSSVRIIATDLSREMGDYAKAVDDPPLENTSFREVDATELPYADRKFAAVVSQFGVMFFPDKPKAYAEAFRVLQPGGLFAFSTWDSFDVNPLTAVARDAAAPLLPDDVPPFMSIPFSYFDLNLIRQDLSAAGFGEIRLCVLPGLARAAHAREAAEAFVFGSPLGAQLDQAGQQAAGIDALEQAISQRFGAGPLEAPMQAIVVEAFKPA